MRFSSATHLINDGLYFCLLKQKYGLLADILSAQYGAKLVLPPYHKEISDFFPANQVVILCDKFPWTIGVVPNTDSEMYLSVLSTDLAKVFPSRAINTDARLVIFHEDGSVQPFSRK